MTKEKKKTLMDSFLWFSFGFVLVFIFLNSYWFFKIPRMLMHISFPELVTQIDKLTEADRRTHVAFQA